MRVLIVTLPGDSHAHAVAWVLKRRGHIVHMIYPLDLCDGGTWSFDPISRRMHVCQGGTRVNLLLEEIDALWLRRVPSVYPLSSIDDTQERSGSETELEYLVSGLLQAIGDNVFTVNQFGFNASASRKTSQMSLAAKKGFTLPKTLVSNDIAQIEEFYEEVHGKMVYKPLKAVLWTREDKSKTITMTTEIHDISLLRSANVQISPGIYQEMIDKSSEVRVTVMGNSFFALEKSPKDGEIFKDVDWRTEQGRRCQYKIHQLPNDIQDKCLSLMTDLGISFGCFDFALLDTGEYIFFEVNPGGQFLFFDIVEMEIPQFSLLGAFVLFLESKNEKFLYKPELDLSFRDFLAEYDLENATQQEASNHVGILDRWNYGRASVAF